MDINNTLLLWIIDSQVVGQGGFLNGSAFDGEQGFGNLNQKEYVGSLASFTQQKKVFDQAKLNAIYQPNVGWRWKVNVLLPSKPLLLTNDVRINYAYECSVKLNLTAQAKHIFSRRGPGFYLVVGRSFCGVLLHTEARDVLKFYSYEKMNPTRQKLYFSEWRCPLGVIEAAKLLPAKKGS